MAAFLSVSAQDILWHYLPSHKAISVLSTEEFQLKFSEGTEAETWHGNAYYLSMTRHNLGAYNKNPNTGNVLFEMDGRKLGHNYKIKSVDYWQDYFSESYRATGHEGEDRLFTNKSTIENASRYIKSVHYLHANVGGKYQDKDLNKRAIALGKLCKIKGIPLYVYEDKRSFLFRNKAKSVSILEHLGEEKRQRKWPTSLDSNTFKVWVELWFQPKDKHTLSLEAIKLKQELYAYNVDMLERQFKNDLHGAKNDTIGGKNHKQSRRLVESVLRRGITPKQFIQKLISKWN